MTRIVWTLQAVEDVEAIRAYIARDSPHYGALMAERIVESIERLAENRRLISAALQLPVAAVGGLEVPDIFAASSARRR